MSILLFIQYTHSAEKSVFSFYKFKHNSSLQSTVLGGVNVCDVVNKLCFDLIQHRFSSFFCDEVRIFEFI
jgi:hypothetical protein